MEELEEKVDFLADHVADLTNIVAVLQQDLAVKEAELNFLNEKCNGMQDEMVRTLEGLQELIKNTFED